MGDVGFGDRIGGDRLLEKSAEDKTAVAAGSPVETKGELRHVRLKMFGGSRSLMGLQNPSFEQAATPGMETCTPGMET